MAQTPESKVKAKVVKLVKAYGIYYFFPATHGFGRSGVPDVICCANGKFLAIECKAGTNKPTALQEKEINDIQKSGGFAYVINETNLPTLENILRSLLDEDDNDGRC
jgi:Holliday junction resolvase